MVRSLIRGLLIFLGVVVAFALAVGALYYADRRHKAALWKESQQKNEAEQREWLAAYNRRLGPLDVRNQAALPKLRELLVALWPAYGVAKDAPAPRCPGKLAGKVGLTYPEELKSFASGGTREEMNYADSGYSDLYDRYVRTWEDRPPLNQPPVIVQGAFNDRFNVDAEELLKLPYLVVAQIDEYNEASVKRDGQGYQGGRVAGQLYLFEQASRRYICRIPFSATSSQEVSAQYRRTRLPSVGTRHDEEIAERNERARRQSLAGALEGDLKGQTQAGIRQALQSLSPELVVYKPEKPQSP